MGSHVLVLKDTQDQHVLLTLMTAALLLVLMVAVLTNWLPTSAYAMLAGQAPTVLSILMTVVRTLVCMEDLAL